MLSDANAAQMLGVGGPESDEDGGLGDLTSPENMAGRKVIKAKKGKKKDGRAGVSQSRKGYPNY